MRWKFWSSKQSAGVETVRQQEVLPMIAERMRRFGASDWHVQDDLVKGPGSVGIRLRDNHTDSAAHLDLDFILNVDQPTDTTILDCIQGYGLTTRAARRNAIDTWATVTASTAIELLTHDGSHAEHFQGNDPRGFPGWHAIHGPVIGFGLTDATKLQQWILDIPVMPALAPALQGDLDREHLNGVKIFFGGTAGHETCEVRVNGRASATATDVLFGLDWPRLHKAAFCRTFVLLVHQEDHGCAA